MSHEGRRVGLGAIMVRESDEKLHDAVRTAADILETIGPSGFIPVLARADRLEREGDWEGCHFWRRVARAMRSLAIHSAVENQPDVTCSRPSGWVFMQQVETCFHEADKLEAQARASADPSRGDWQEAAAEWRATAEALSKLDAYA